jgi:hypothetical protein
MPVPGDEIPGGGLPSPQHRERSTLCFRGATAAANRDPIIISKESKVPELTNVVRRAEAGNRP